MNQSTLMQLLLRAAALALLHVIGIASGPGMQRLGRERIIRTVGAGVALCGIYLSAA